MSNIRPSDAKYKLIGGVFAKVAEVTLDDRFMFDCLRCGWCCSYPPGINPKEASRIANYLGLSKKDFFDGYVTLQEDDSYGWKAKIDKRGDNCAFWSKDNGKATCKIHSVKPRQCKVKPVLRLGNESFEGLEAMRLLFEPCRGFGRGKEYTVREWIKTNNLEEAWKEEVDYFSELVIARMKTPSNQLKSKIEDMFTS